MPALGSIVRREETLLEIGRLHADFCSWLAARRTLDPGGLHQTQLDRLETLVTRAITSLQDDVSGSPVDPNPAAVYESCRRTDERLFWLRWVWTYFKDKIDQRDDATVGRLLRAADEVVWSCYRQVTARVELLAPGLLTLEAAPLPYIEARYSPSAFPPELVPGELTIEIDETFRIEHLNRLPLPLVRLPPICVNAPWWLVYVGHEVGHHVQARLGFVEDYKTVLARVVMDQTQDEVAAGRWRLRAMEIFADIFSVLVMGSWAVEAMVDLEFGPPEVMLKPRHGRYPAPIVRLAILAQTADCLGLPGTGALGDVDPRAVAAGSQQVLEDLDLVPHLVKSTLAYEFRPGVTLEVLCDFDPFEFDLQGPAMADWLIRLRTPRDASTIRGDLKQPRFATAALRALWTEVITTSPDAATREQARGFLAENAICWIADAGEKSTRAREKPPQLADDASGLLADALMALPLE